MSDDQPQEGGPNPPSPEEIERLKATPGFKEIFETLKHLEEYDDFSSKFLDRFPDSLPRKFRLKLGPEAIGMAIVDWRKVMTKLFAFAIGSAKPTELSEDEYVRQVEEYFGSLTNKQIQEELLPHGSTMWHMMEFLPQKLNDAIIHLAIEGRQKIVIRRQLEIGANIPSPAKFADQVAKMEREAIKKRLPQVKANKNQTGLEKGRQSKTLCRSG